ncbi:hypothetical protein AMELA_G00211740 [Ameiurus melas]|uniref:Uncharacterized protein n=1 Tax=Ameiurus melas TaxID=219545 RepID=A0A7J6A4R6_AMEME|nr:hypothetical protein AMELA_G00211740 [Ameiurus melas]
MAALQHQGCKLPLKYKKKKMMNCLAQCSTCRPVCSLQNGRGYVVAPPITGLIEHFAEDSFLNLGEYSAGYTQRLLLKPGAVPTLFPTLFGPSRVSESQPSTSQQGQGSKQCSALSGSRHVGCQTDGVETRSVGTLPLVSPKMRSVGTQLSMDHARDLVWRRRRTETGVSEIMKTHDSAYKPRDSDEPELSPQSSYSVPKYIVFESCLRELFETRPFHKTKWEVHSR